MQRCLDLGMNPHHIKNNNLKRVLPKLVTKSPVKRKCDGTTLIRQIHKTQTFSENIKTNLKR